MKNKGRARFIENEWMAGGRILATGEEGKIEGRITYKGNPIAGIKLREENEITDTRNGKGQIAGTTREGEDISDENGVYGDTVGISLKTDGTEIKNKAIRTEFATNVWTSIHVQRLTLTLAAGRTCMSTSRRTLTNEGPDGKPRSNYILTSSQPVVTSAY